MLLLKQLNSSSGSQGILCYGTLRFIPLLTRDRYWNLSLQVQSNPMQLILASYFLKIYPNIAFLPKLFCLTYLRQKFSMNFASLDVACQW